MYAISYRGHGRSDGDLKGVGISDYVEDVKTVVDRISEKPILIGHSMGGAVIQRYVGEYENTVTAMILLASATAPRMPVLETICKNIFDVSFWPCNLISIGVRIRGRCLRKSAFFAGGKVSDEDLEFASHHLQRESYSTILELMRKNYSSCYPTQHIPVMVIGSEKDKYFSRKSLVQTGIIYGVDPVILIEGGHDIMLDRNYEMAAKKIEGFLSNLLRTDAETLP